MKDTYYIDQDGTLLRGYSDIAYKYGIKETTAIQLIKCVHPYVKLRELGKRELNKMLKNEADLEGITPVSESDRVVFDGYNKSIRLAHVSGKIFGTLVEYWTSCETYAVTAKTARNRENVIEVPEAYFIELAKMNTEDNRAKSIKECWYKYTDKKYPIK